MILAQIIYILLSVLMFRIVNVGRLMQPFSQVVGLWAVSIYKLIKTASPHSLL